MNISGTENLGSLICIFILAYQKYILHALYSLNALSQKVETILSAFWWFFLYSFLIGNWFRLIKNISKFTKNTELIFLLFSPHCSYLCRMQRNKGQFTSSKPIQEDSLSATTSWESNETWCSDGNGSHQQEILLVFLFDVRLNTI